MLNSFQTFFYLNHLFFYFTVFMVTPDSIISLDILCNDKDFLLFNFMYYIVKGVFVSEKLQYICLFDE